MLTSKVGGDISVRNVIHSIEQPFVFLAILKITSYRRCLSRSTVVLLSMAQVQNGRLYIRYRSNSPKKTKQMSE